MEINNQEIIANLLTPDGKGRKTKKENLSLLLKRMTEFEEKSELDFYISICLSEIEAYSGR